MNPGDTNPIVSFHDGIKPGSKIRIEFDIWDEDDMRAQRALVEVAVNDAVTAVHRKIGIVAGAESIPEAWIKMIARSGAKLVLGAMKNPDRTDIECYSFEESSIPELTSG